MSRDSESPAPAPRDARRQLILPLAFLTGALALFLVLFWEGAHPGRKRHGAAGAGSPAEGRTGRGGNDEVTGAGESPVGGGPRTGGSPKGDAWWYREGKSRRSAPENAWWSPRKKGPKSAAESGPSGGKSKSDNPKDPAGRNAGKPATPSAMNPGEAAGQTGPDDYWWRK